MQVSQSSPLIFQITNLCEVVDQLGIANFIIAVVQFQNAIGNRKQL